MASIKRCFDIPPVSRAAGLLLSLTWWDTKKTYTTANAPVYDTQYVYIAVVLFPVGADLCTTA